MYSQNPSSSSSAEFQEFEQTQREGQIGSPVAVQYINGDVANIDLTSSNLAKKTFEPFIPNRRTCEEANRIFWMKQRRAYADMDDDQTIFHCRHMPFPVARVKKIMRVDEDVKPLMLGADATVFMAAAAKLFVEELTQISWFLVNDARRRTVHKEDLCSASRVFDHFDFLIDTVPQPQQLVTQNLQKLATAAVANSTLDGTPRAIGRRQNDQRGPQNEHQQQQEQQHQQQQQQHQQQQQQNQQLIEIQNGHQIIQVPQFQPQPQQQYHLEVIQGTNDQHPIQLAPTQYVAYTNENGDLVLNGNLPEGTQYALRPDGTLELIQDQNNYHVLQPLQNVNHEAEVQQLQSEEYPVAMQQEEPLD